MKALIGIVGGLTLALFGGCSGDAGPVAAARAPVAHAWQGQVQALGKARQVEQGIRRNAMAQRRRIASETR